MDNSHKTLSEEYLQQLIALYLIPGIGSRHLFALKTHYQDLNLAWAAPAREWRALGIPAAICEEAKKPDHAVIEKNLRWQEKPNQTILCWDDPRYPALLREISQPPMLLYVQGQVELLAQHQIALVGSRNPTPLGQETAFAFAHSLATAGLIITSGLALGIDAAAHLGALAAKHATIAVLGTGIDHIYPKQHLNLAAQISAQGAVISEFPLGVTAQAQHFPQRNRIISGLSMGVVVVEAALQSGSLITARYALEQGREVFAIPGSIHNPLARGCHHLLRQGAKLVETAEDVLEELSALSDYIHSAKPHIATPLENKKNAKIASELLQLLPCIDVAGTSIDDIQARSGLPLPELSAMLTELELQGWIGINACGYQRIKG